MPKPQPKANLIRQQLLAGLIETKPVSWDRKTLSKDKDGKEVPNTTKVTRQGLRFPLAQNVSSDNVEAAAKRWLR